MPIHAKTLERLAKAANVSPVVVACRVVSAADELGLNNAAVVFFVEGIEQWRFSRGLQFDKAAATALMKQAAANDSEIVREENQDGNVVVGSIIDAQIYQVLLIQLLPPATAIRQTREERMQLLAAQVFGGDLSFQQSVAAVLGGVKQKCEGQTLEAAIEFFQTQYLGLKYTGARDRQLAAKPVANT